METINNTQTYYSPTDISEKEDDSRAAECERILKEKVGDRHFPCVGAKQAVYGAEYRFGTYQSMDDPASASLLAHDLQRYIDETLDHDSQFMTMIAVFENEIFCEEQFESLLWKQLSLLKKIDPKKDEAVEGVSQDPTEANYSFTFNGEAFYVVGMHPHASRLARQFPYPSLAFNLNKQFSKLKESGKFNRMKQVIRKRDMALQGSINPMLSDFGEGLEAPQYSGREVSDSWKCPFH